MRGLQTVVAVACLFSTALVAADNPFIGTWNLNPGKSKFAPGTELKEMTVSFAAVGNEMKRTVSGIDPDGQQINQSSTIAWDGNAHKIEAPNAPPIMVAVKKVGDHTLDVTVKQPDGKLLDTVKAIVSKDGKSMTVTEKGQDPKGRKLDNTEVFEKQ
jgi:hypothetical protein